MSDNGYYPIIWDAVAQLVKEQAGWRCIHCGHPNGPECDDLCQHLDGAKQRVLTVHHLDGDKSKVIWWNLAALCQVCHLHIQARWHPDQEPLPDAPRWMDLRHRTRRIALTGHAPPPEAEAGAYIADPTTGHASLDRVAFLDWCIARYRERVPEATPLLLADVPEYDKELQAIASAHHEIVWVRTRRNLGGRNLELRSWQVT